MLELGLTDYIDDSIDVLIDVQTAYSGTNLNAPRLWLVPRAQLRGHPDSEAARHTAEANQVRFTAHLAEFHRSLLKVRTQAPHQTMPHG